MHFCPATIPLPIIALCLASLLFCFVAGNNTIELFHGDKYAQTQVAKDIRELNPDNPTLLCYKMVDRGFYRAAGITPSTKYFALNCYSRESYPEMYDEYERYIKEGVCEFVVVFKDTYDREKEFFDKYTVVKEYSYKFYDCNYSGYDAEYVLLRLSQQN